MMIGCQRGDCVPQQASIVPGQKREQLCAEIEPFAALLSRPKIAFPLGGLFARSSPHECVAKTRFALTFLERSAWAASIFGARRAIAMYSLMVRLIRVSSSHSKMRLATISSAGARNGLIALSPI